MGLNKQWRVLSQWDTVEPLKSKYYILLKDGNLLFLSCYLHLIVIRDKRPELPLSEIQ
jgi:hypothetical protein